MLWRAKTIVAIKESAVTSSYFSSRPFLFTCFGAIFLTVILFVSSGFAQSTGGSPPEQVGTDQMIEGWRAQLNQISSAVERDGITDQELLDFRSRVSEIHEEAMVFSAEITPKVQSLTGRISKLVQAENTTLTQDAPAPPAVLGDETGEKSEDEAENPPSSAEAGDRSAGAKPKLSEAEQALTREKADLEAEAQRLSAQLGRAEVIILQADELEKQITQTRRDKFTGRLFEKAKSIVSPGLWVATASEIVPLLHGLVAIVTSGTTRIYNEALPLFAGAVAFSLLLVYILLMRLPILLLPHMEQAEDVSPARVNKGLNALKRIARSLTAFILSPTLVLLALSQANVMSARLSDLSFGVLKVLFFYALARGLSLAIYAPGRRSYRLVSLDDQQAWRVHKTIMICLTIALCGLISISLARGLVVSPDVQVTVYGTMSMVFSVVVVWRYLADKFSEGETPYVLTDILVLRILGIFVLAALVAAFFAPVVGYPFLGYFAVQQIVLAGIIAAIIFICFNLLDNFLTSHHVIQEDGVMAVTSRTDKERRYTQFLLLLTGIGKVLLSLLGVGIFAAAWGLDTTRISHDLLKLFQEIKIGQLTFSPSTIVLALLVLAIGILITRALQRWMSNRLLPTTTLDLGLQNSITTGIGYLGFIASAMVAFSQAGLDLSSLAIVAGALSLGIGFGLQSIVSNFVSGIILLAERPIKAGDWIAVGGEEGTVQKISVRSTEIETFDRATVIVPNADFIAGTVKNFMHGDTVGRFIVTVGVGYDSDPDQVREILLECAQNHPLILAYPETYVIFSDFGASSLDFELRGYLSDCGDGLTVRSDLRFAILKRLREEEIEIPFPHREISIKGLDTATTLLGGNTKIPDKAKGKTSGVLTKNTVRPRTESVDYGGDE